MLQSMMPQLLLVGKLFLLMAVGILLRKIKMITDDGKTFLSNLVLDVILPCNIVVSFVTGVSRDDLVKSGQMFVVSLVIQVISYGLSFVLYRFCDPAHRSVLKYGTVCSNSGTLGTTVAQEIFGSQGTLFATIYCTPLRIAMWTFGLSFFTHKTDNASVKKILTNPCIVAVLFGLFCMITKLQFPAVISRTMESIGQCNTPMAMIMVGSLIADMELTLLFHWEGWYYAVIRLVALPFATLIGCRIFCVAPLIRNIAVVLTAMPMGCTTPILAYKYGADSAFSAAVTASTTVLSLIAIPVWCMLLA